MKKLRERNMQNKKVAPEEYRIAVAEYLAGGV